MRAELDVFIELSRAKTVDEARAVFDTIVVDEASPFGRVAACETK